MLFFFTIFNSKGFTLFENVMTGSTPEILPSRNTSNSIVLISRAYPSRVLNSVNVCFPFVRPIHSISPLSFVFSCKGKGKFGIICLNMTFGNGICVPSCTLINFKRFTVSFTLNVLNALICSDVLLVQSNFCTYTVLSNKYPCGGSIS